MERGLVLNQIYRNQVIEALRKMGEVAGWGDVCAEAAALLEKDDEAIATLVNSIMAHEDALGKGLDVLCKGLRMINEADARALKTALEVMSMLDQAVVGGVVDGEPDY